jgi:hypothetical protein
MFRPLNPQLSAKRRAVILMIVLVLLTLFAIVALAFVLYASGEADASRSSREASTAAPYVTTQPYERYDSLIDLAMAQVLFGVSDPVSSYPSGACSAIRGHDLARDIYGWNYDNPGNNIYPFNGTGRLHNQIGLPPTPNFPQGVQLDDYTLINYVPYLSNVNQFNTPGSYSLTDGFVRDPERTGPYVQVAGTYTVLGYRTNSYATINNQVGLAQSAGAYSWGWNSSYTYPDGNHVYLGAADSYGNVIARSFHRPYLIPYTLISVNGGPFQQTPQSVQCLPLDPNAPGYWTWYANTNPNSPPGTVEIVPPTYLKYTCLRMRPVDHLLPGESFIFPAGSNIPSGISSNRPYFPAPALGGDVQNLRSIVNPSAPGAGDSIWIDLDYPVKTASNGVKYKPLFAFFIMDLDGKVNLNSHGNISAVNQAHASNQGWGKWEINPSQLANASGNNQAAAEWPQLFVGNPTFPSVPGRYGSNLVPGPVNNSNIAASGRSPHTYAMVDYDATNDGQGGAFTGSLQFPANACFPTFPAGYTNGSQVERTNHPLLYDPLWPGLPLYPNSTNRRFDAGNLVMLYNRSALGSNNNLNCDIGRLLPINMGSPSNTGAGSRIPFLVTTDSNHLDRPALMPWLWDRTSAVNGTASFYGYKGATDVTGTTSRSQAPSGQAIAFPALSQRYSQTVTIPASSEFGTVGQSIMLPNPPNPANTFNTAIDWRSVDAVLGKVNLNRFLSPYPHMGSGTNPNPYNQQTNPNGFLAQPMGTGAPTAQNPLGAPPLLGAYDRFDGWGNSAAIAAQFQQAQADRQKLADDIYRRLLLVTGVPACVNPATPTAQELASRRWLAQLAVNIVDYVDEDEISTPFNFYTTADGLPAASVSATNNLGNNLNLNLTYLNAQEGNPLYWVFGTEMPKVLINEVLAEFAPPAANPGQTTVNVFVELFNPIAVDTTGTAQAQDSAAVPFYVPTPANNTGNAYNPYILVVSDNNVLAGNGPGLAVTGTQSPFNNDAILGTPNNVLAQTDFSNVAKIQTVDVKPQAAQPQIGGPQYPQPNPVVLNPQYFLVGPAGSDAHGTIAPQANGGTAVVPGGTPMLTTTNMQFQGNTDANGNFATTSGVNVLLRRLVNPHLPFDSNPANATYNPYMTVDYIGGGAGAGGGVPTAAGVMPQNTTNSYNSTAKFQPYAGYPSQVRSSNPPTALAPATPATSDTFGFDNGLNPNGKNSSYDWLMHLDRQLASPLDLLHVSGCQPWELTRRFKSPSGGGAGAVSYNHQINWYDETNRLYRIFEFLHTADRTTGVSPSGRIPGMMNINAIWDKEIFEALCDAQQANGFYVAGQSNKLVDTAFLNMIASRSTAYTPGTGGQVAAFDRPFRSLGTANLPQTDPQAVYENYSQPASTRGIEDTFLRSLNGYATNALNDSRLFDTTATANPTGKAPTSWTPPTPTQTELIRKIAGHVTTRSNVFAVWMTVGYFQVLDDTVRPVKLGAELGVSTNTNIRQRFFSIIDRSKMVIAPQLTTLVAAPANVNVASTVQVNALGTFAANGNLPGGGGQAAGPNNISWGIPGLAQVSGAGAGGGGNQNTVIVGPGTPMVLIIDNGTASEETVVVQPPTNAPVMQQGNNSGATWYFFTATFRKAHAAGATITIPGNPGPQPGLTVNGCTLTYPGIIAAYGVLE